MATTSGRKQSNTIETIWKLWTFIQSFALFVSVTLVIGVFIYILAST